MRLETYQPENHALFAAAIQESYRDTLDCPALSGLRDIEDVIAGHQSVGTFDPALPAPTPRMNLAWGPLPVGEIRPAPVHNRASNEHAVTIAALRSLAVAVFSRGEVAP